MVGSSNFPQISSNSSFGDAVVQSKPAAESSESSSDEEEDNEEKFQDEALKAHNDCRAKHGVELLKLDKKVRIIYNSSKIQILDRHYVWRSHDPMSGIWSIFF